MNVTIHGIVLRINMEVNFRLNSLTDAQTYRGTIIGIGGFDIASVYNDVVVVHNNMESSIARQEPASLTYLIIKCTDGVVRPFATTWINEESFDTVDQVSDMQIICHNLSEIQRAKILTYIRDYYGPVTVIS